MHVEQSVAADVSHRPLHPTGVERTATRSAPSPHGGRRGYPLTGAEPIPWRRRGFGFGSIG